MRFLPIAIIIVSVAVYQVCLKSVSRGHSPMALLCAVYLVALVGAALTVPLTREGSLFSVSHFAPAVILLGLSCFGVEAGYLLAYRGGWDMTQLFAHTLVGNAVARLLLSYWYYGEAISATNVVGVAVASLGVFLMRG